MGLPLFFADSSALSGVGMEIELVPDEAAHMRARRISEGDRIGLSDGRGTVAEAVVVRMERRQVKVLITALSIVEDDRSPVEIVCSIIKRERMNWAVSKAAEAGVRKIHPVYTRYTVSGQDSRRDMVRVRRWNRLCMESLKQSGGRFVTEVASPCPIGQLLESLDGSLSMIVMNASSAGLSVYEAWCRQGCRIQVIVFIGPEGGFSSEELRMFGKHGCSEACLGNRILRSETAVAVSAVMAGLAVSGVKG